MRPAHLRTALVAAALLSLAACGGATTAADGVVIALNLRSGEDPRLPALADVLLCSER